MNLVTHRPTTAAELEHRCRDGGLTIDRPAESSDVVRTNDFLTRWLRVVDATTDRERADELNSLTAESSAYPRLTDHAGDGWHIHYRDPHLPLADVVRALVSVGTALHLAGRGMHRLGRCAADGCDTVFADFSRTGRQRYCGTACSNRDAVRRHRAKAG